MPQGILAGGLLLVLLLSVFLIAKISKSRGVAKGTVEAHEEQDALVNEQNEIVSRENEAVVKEVEKTHEIHDRLNTDPEFADRVRDRFTRDD